MRDDRWRARAGCWLLVVAGLVVLGACGGSDDEEAEATESSAVTADATGDTAAGDDSASEAEGTTTSSTTDTSAEDATSEEDDTEAEEDDASADDEAAPAAPPAPGTGVLTIDGVDFPFTVDECNFEPELITQTNATVLFSMRGTTEAEGREVRVNASRIESGTSFNDTFGYAYADDPNDFTTAVIVGTGGSTGDQFEIDGDTYAAGPLPFARTEGVTVVEDVDPGPGSIIYTC